MHINTVKTKEAGMRKIEKALTSSDFLNGGQANADRSNVFERYLRGTNDMMNLADIEFTDTLRVTHDQEYIGRRFLGVGTEATTYTDIKEPDYDGGTTTLKKFTGAYTISYEALLENIEKKDYQPRLTAQYMKKAASDMSDVLVNGDTTSGTPFYAQFNGFGKLADSAYVIDANGSTINRNLFYQGFRGLPKEVRRRKNDLRWFTNTLLETDWREVYGNRATMGGDNSTRGITVSPDGIAFALCDEIPDTESVGYTSATYGEHIGTAYDTFVIAAATNDAITLNQTIDGAASGNTALTATAGTYTAPELAAHLNAKAVLGGLEACFDARDGNLVVRTTKSGANQSIEVVAVANDMYTTVGFTAAAYSGAAASAAGTINRGTYALLTMPENFKVYIKEEFRTYWEYIPRSDEYEFTTHFFCAPRLKDYTGLVKLDEIRLLDYV
jgi:hypothetical protein